MPLQPTAHGQRPTRCFTAENINNHDLLGSGGHVWVWDDRQRVEKVVTTSGAEGAFSTVTQKGPRNGHISGRAGGGAVLKATGASRADADAALSALESAIEALCDTGEESPWEDDQGRAGAALVLVRYQRAGHRAYSFTVAGAVQAWVVWQFYTLEVRENTGIIYG